MTKIHQAIFYSALAHILFILIISFAPQFRWPFGERPMVLWVELPRGTSEEIGTGLKESAALPKSTIEEQKALLKEEEKKPKEAMPEPSKKKAKEAKPLTKEDKKMKDALAKIEKQLKKRNVQPEAAQIGGSGEGYKYGTSDKPLRVPIDDPEYVKYQAMIRGKIISEWIVPARYGELPDAERPKARIIVMINEDGEVLSAQWDKHSSDASFDASCMRAVQHASPFEVPPERLKWEAYNEGFLVEFDPRLKP